MVQEVLSFEAIRWLTKQDVQITVLNWNGKLLTMILPPNYAIYQNEEELKEKILGLTPMEARILGLNPETLRQI
jgi:hypothetical protein